jgi:hypothetical protein
MISSAIAKWFLAYKKWEQQDNFTQAFREGRMTMRHPKNNAIDSKNTDIFGYNRETGAKVTSTFIHQVGLTGIPEMRNPLNFAPGKGHKSQKAELGLYELSASLLDPKRPISNQTFAQLQHGHLFAFMPLSNHRDQIIYAILNNWRKRLGPDHPLSTVVHNIRARMTRIKLAAEHDMGTGYTMLGNDGNARKLKYGVGLGKQTKQSYYDEGSSQYKLRQLQVTKEIIGKFENDALYYERILTGHLKVNEIIVAYRHHANPDFPMFVRYDDVDKRFHVVHLTHDNQLEEDQHGRFVEDDGTFGPD